MDEAYCAAAESLPKNSAASHILLENEEDAKAVHDELVDEGADFAEAGERKIHGFPSGPAGGTLDGFGAPALMVPAFETLSPELEVGAVSEPV